MAVIRILSILLALIISSSSYAKKVVLFDNNITVNPVQFNIDVEKIKKGDEVLFSDDKSYVFGKFLGRGKSSLIYALDDNWAIRIPSDYFRKESLNSTVYGYEQLKRFGIPSVNLDLDNYTRGELLVVERINIKKVRSNGVLVELTLENYLANYKDLKNDFYNENLINFSSHTAHFKKFGDFYNTSQIAWNGLEWVLIDWDAGHSLLESDMSDKAHVFADVRKEFPRKLYNEIRDNIFKVRADSEFISKHRILSDNVNKSSCTSLVSRLYKSR